MGGLGMPRGPAAVLVLLLQPAATRSRAPACSRPSSGCRLARVRTTASSLAGTLGGRGAVLLELRPLLVAAGALAYMGMEG